MPDPITDGFASKPLAVDAAGSTPARPVSAIAHTVSMPLQKWRQPRSPTGLHQMPVAADATGVAPTGGSTPVRSSLWLRKHRPHLFTHGRDGCIRNSCTGNTQRRAVQKETGCHPSWRSTERQSALHLPACRPPARSSPAYVPRERAVPPVHGSNAIRTGPGEEKGRNEVHCYRQSPPLSRR